MVLALPEKSPGAEAAGVFSVGGLSFGPGAGETAGFEAGVLAEDFPGAPSDLAGDEEGLSKVRNRLSMTTRMLDWWTITFLVAFRTPLTPSKCNSPSHCKKSFSPGAKENPGIKPDAPAAADGFSAPAGG